MDTLHGQDGIAEDAYDYDAIETPPSITDNERRLHVRAYNHWASLLGTRALPSIEDLNPAECEDFGPYSVLLDFSMGLENPAIIYVGAALREECGIEQHIERTDDVPARSLLSRLTDHYLQIIANSAPVGFEAEFVNQRDAQIMYRGILMPFSSDDETIDFIYGVISWKEMASDAVSEALNAEIENALSSPSVARTATAPWADGPAAVEQDVASTSADDDFGFDEEPFALESIPAPAENTASEAESIAAEAGDDLDDEAFDELDLSAFAYETAEPEALLPDLEVLELSEVETAPLSVIADDFEMPRLNDVLDLNEADHDLGGALDLARQSASEARECDARSRAALYRAIGHAYDFALAARIAPDDYAALLERSGITVQERSPMTAVIKLVFGADYEKTRIAEYATALEYAFAEGLPKGALARQLAFYNGGLKGLVAEMRDARRVGAVRPNQRIERARRKLAKTSPIAIADLSVDGEGLAVAVVRREADGSLTILAAIDTQEKIAQQVLIEATRRRPR